MLLFSLIICSCLFNMTVYNKLTHLKIFVYSHLNKKKKNSIKYCFMQWISQNTLTRLFTIAYPLIFVLGILSLKINKSIKYSFMQWISQKKPWNLIQCNSTMLSTSRIQQDSLIQLVEISINYKLWGLI